MLELRICGNVEVEIDGRLLPESMVGGRQGRLVLAYLAWARGVVPTPARLLCRCRRRPREML